MKERERGVLGLFYLIIWTFFSVLVGGERGRERRGRCREGWRERVERGREREKEEMERRMERGFGERERDREREGWRDRALSSRANRAKRECR